MLPNLYPRGADVDHVGPGTRNRDRPFPHNDREAIVRAGIRAGLLATRDDAQAAYDRAVSRGDGGIDRIAKASTALSLAQSALDAHDAEVLL